jgi:protein-disulfide isomerase
MKKKLLALALLVSCPLVVFAQSNEDLQKQINMLNETNKAILKELQEIRKVLERQQVPSAPPQVADTLPTEPIDVSRDPFRGPANAKVAIIEYSDYQCPFCGRFEKDQYAQILRDYVTTGKVKYVWRDMPLDMHPNAQKAAEAGHCAGAQGKFWEMHDLMFANQQALARPDLAKHAATLNLNVGQFESCLDSGRYAADISADVADAAKANISGTPSFLFGLVQPNGTVKVVKKIVGTKPYAEFKAAIDSALAR